MLHFLLFTGLNGTTHYISIILSVNMISKKQLKGKFVTYIDKHGKWRTEKVIKVTENYLTVKNAVKTKHRIYKDRVVGMQFRKRGREEIQW